MFRQSRGPWGAGLTFCYFPLGCPRILFYDKPHLVVQTGDISLACIMHNLSLRYTKWINFTHSRTGHVFQGHYKALLLDADIYLMELVRYVHLNPVRAKMVISPDDYPWSGHYGYLGKEVLPWLTTDWVLSVFFTDIQKARHIEQRVVMIGALA